MFYLVTILHKRLLYDLVSMLLGHTSMPFVHRQCYSNTNLW